MNTAAQLLNKSTLSRTWVVSFLISKAQFSLFLLSFAVLISALSIVYVTNASRGCRANIQQFIAERNQLHTEWGQLLLEKATWTMQARVEQVANDKLSMVIPDTKSVVIIDE